MNELSYLWLAFRNFIQPLYDSLSSLESLEYLFYRYGWNIALEDSAFAEINQLTGLKTVFEQLFTEAETIEQKIANDPNYSLSSADIESIASLAQQIYTIIKGMEAADLSSLIEPLNTPEFWEDIAGQLLADLQEIFLRVYYPKAYSFLHLFGVVRYEAVAAAPPGRIAYTRTVVDWVQAVAVIKNPLGAFKQIYHWDDPAQDFDHQGLLSALEKALRAIGLAARLAAPARTTLNGLPSTAPFTLVNDENALRIRLLYALGIGQPAVTEIGLELIPAIKTGDTKASGLLLQPVLRAGTGVAFPFGQEFKISMTAGVDASGALGLNIFPSGVGLVTSQPQINFGLQFSRADTTDPWYLVGSANTSRIELSGIGLGFSLEGTVTDPELKLSLQLGKDGSTPGCKVVIPLGHADTFIKNNSNPSGINFAFGGNILWSSKTGLRFNGEANVDITIPFSVKVGPLTLKNAHIAVQEGSKTAQPSGLELVVGTQLEGSFGPIAFAVDDMGLKADVIPYSDSDLQQLPDGADQPMFGNLDFKLGFAPPKGIGIAVNAGTVSGSGYLFFDTDKGEYAGVADLNIKGKINIKAFGVILTHMPDGGPGYSFMLMISAEFPPIELGLGFSLTGLGGLIGIHRQIAIDALEQGVYNNDIGNVLFPTDPLNNAYALITSIDRLFPPLQGAYTFGIMAKIDWGPAGIISIEVGLILEYPDPVRIALIGVLRAMISKKLAGKDVTVLNLQVNFAGSIDFDQDYIRFDASLVQSKLLSMTLTGDMALRVKYGANSDFVVTLGGFHPNFQPPALDLPATIHRMQINILTGNPSLSVSCYIAVTSNTYQFGAAGLFTFSKWGVGVRGELSFDALYQRKPFHFYADVHFLLAASWKGYDFASIVVNGTFDGPSPWELHASLTLSVWIFSTTIPLDHVWGDPDESLLDAVSILPLLVEDLQHIGNWEHTNGQSNLCVSLRKIVADPNAPPVLWLHPNEILTVRQSTIPLGLTIDKFADGKPQDANVFHIELLQNGTTVPATAVQDRFASAKFIQMTDEQELSAPAYELFDSGLTFNGMDALVFDQISTQPLVYESRVIDDPAMEPQPPWTFGETGLNFIQGLLNNAISNSSFGQWGGTRAPAPVLIGEKFVVVNQDGFTIAGSGPVSSEALARQMMQEMKAEDAKGILTLAVIPQAEMN